MERMAAQRVAGIGISVARGKQMRSLAGARFDAMDNAQARNRDRGYAEAVLPKESRASVVVQGPFWQFIVLGPDYLAGSWRCRLRGGAMRDNMNLSEDDERRDMTEPRPYKELNSMLTVADLYDKENDVLAGVAIPAERTGEFIKAVERLAVKKFDGTVFSDLLDEDIDDEAMDAAMGQSRLEESMEDVIDATGVVATDSEKREPGIDDGCRIIHLDNGDDQTNTRSLAATWIQLTSREPILLVEWPV